MSRLLWTQKEPGFENWPRRPPWQVFPYPWGSMGWRMGDGELYWCHFTNWFAAQDQEARARFVAENPEPPDWRYFYEYITCGGDAQRRSELRALIAASWSEYQASEYLQGRAAEDAGDLAGALGHYEKAAQRGDHQDAEERCRRLRRMSEGPSSL